MRALADVIRSPVAIEQTGEDQRLHFRAGALGVLLLVALIFVSRIAARATERSCPKLLLRPGLLCRGLRGGSSATRGRDAALRIYRRSKQNAFSIRRPQLAISFCRNIRKLPCGADFRGLGIEVGYPYLLRAGLGRHVGKVPPIRRPARAIFPGGIEGQLMHRAARGIERRDPNVRLARVLLQVNINHAEQHPAAIGRRHRLVDALQRHHVFKCERPPGLSQSGRGEQQENGSNASFHLASAKGNYKRKPLGPTLCPLRPGPERDRGPTAEYRCPSLCSPPAPGTAQDRALRAGCWSADARSCQGGDRCSSLTHQCPTPGMSNSPSRQLSADRCPLLPREWSALCVFREPARLRSPAYRDLRV